MNAPSSAEVLEARPEELVQTTCTSAAGQQAAAAPRAAASSSPPPCSVFPALPAAPQRVLCIPRAARCGLTSPAEAQLFCYVNHLLICLVCAAQRSWRRRGSHSFGCAGPCTRVGRGKGRWLRGSHSPTGMAVPSGRTEESLSKREAATSVNVAGSALPSCWAQSARAEVRGAGCSCGSGCLPKLVSLRMLYRSRSDNGVSVLLLSSLPLPCEWGHTKGSPA